MARPMTRSRTYIQLAKERVGHLHAILTTSPGTLDTTRDLRILRLLTEGRHIRGIENKDVNSS